MYYLVLLIICAIMAPVRSDYNCDYPSFDDFPIVDEYTDSDASMSSSSDAPLTVNDSIDIVMQQSSTEIPVTTTTSTVPPTTETPRQTPPRLHSVISDSPSPEPVGTRVADDVNSIQQTQINELGCLEVLDGLITSQWQEDIDRLSVNDLGNFSTLIKVPAFKSLYSNPESEWIQDETVALDKLDKCFRNLVSKAAPKMEQKEIECLNKMYSEYFLKESEIVKLMETYIKETSREQLPFRSFYTYFEMTQLLFDNKNIDALDGELRAIHEDMLEFYIKTEEDKAKKIFIVEQECEFKNTRVLREASNDNARYQRFGQLVKSQVNRYLVAEILQRWMPGAIVSESKYNLWSQARETMEKEILDKVSELQQQKRDAQFLCTYAAQLATKFFTDQKTILFDQAKNTSLSLELKTHEKYSYIVALEGLLTEKNDARLPRVQDLVKESKEGYYCLTNFVRMIENHQRYLLASTFVKEELPYGHTYCLIKEMSAGLVNPRYCKCQGTFCEEFGLATVRAERYQLNLLPDGSYTVTTNSSYRIRPLDELINEANQRIAGQKFNTWWYRHQKMPV